MLCVALATCTFACKKTGETAATADAAAAAATGAPTAPATGAAPPPADTPTAAGGEVAALKEVSDCPKSLAGDEEVARTIKKECGPIVVTSNYGVNGTLTLEAGAQLKFQDGTELFVGYNKASKIIVKGTPEDPVILTAAGDAVPGSWRGLRLYDKADRSQLVGLVVEHAGDERGAIFVAAQDVVVKNVTVRSSKEAGLYLDNQGAVSELSGSRFEKTGGAAVSLVAGTVGSLGGGNQLEEGGTIEVRGGTVDKNARWQNAGAPYLLTQDVSVEGKNNVRATLEIQPGVELRFGDGVELSVGYNSAGTLVAVGSAEQPVVFTSAGDKAPGAWQGVVVYRNGEARFENATLEAGGSEEARGAIHAMNGSALSIASCAFKGNRSAVTLEDGVRLKAIAGSKFEGGEKKALRVGPNEFGAVAADNSFADGERVEIDGGDVTSAQTWHAHKVVLEVQDDVSIDKRAALTLAPGIELRFRDGAGMSVGYNEESTLKAAGTAEAPIRLRGAREEAGAWEGLSIYSNARDVVLENVILEHTGGTAGVTVRGTAVVKASNLTCNKCENGAISWECPGKVTTSEIKAGEGTPAAEIKPEGC
jgi:hypothetical protein